MTFHVLCPRDLDLDAMTLVYKLDLTIVKNVHAYQTELSASRLSKVRALQTLTDKQTDANERITKATFADGNRCMLIQTV